MECEIQTKRIWELDFLRGLLIPGMILIHIIYDAVTLYGLVPWQYPRWYVAIQSNYGALFLLVSGISVTLGSRCVRRGITVFSAGMICTAATFGMYLLGMADRGIIIYFGVLHCIGVCMVLWQVFRKWPLWALGLLGAALAAAGLYLRGQVFDFPWLVVFGFTFPGFSSSDYFPLMPNLGYFLMGCALGRGLYRRRRSLLPQVRHDGPVIGMVSAWGRHSLVIYLLHQPVLAAVFQGIMMIRRL